VHLALAARSTPRIGLATAVFIPQQKSTISMTAAVSTMNRVSAGRDRAYFGTGFTANYMIGRVPMPMGDFERYVLAVKDLLSGRTVETEGRTERLMHDRQEQEQTPSEVWLSVFGPRGRALAERFADGMIGSPHPRIPTATMVSGTVLENEESANSERVVDSVGPWRAMAWHSDYARRGSQAVDTMEGGQGWREELEASFPEKERLLWAFEGHATRLTPRDRPLVRFVSSGGVARGELTGDPEWIAQGLEELCAAGHREVIYTPSGDVIRELRAFASAAARAPSISLGRNNERKSMKAYVIITEDVHDDELMGRYAAASVPPLLAHGGRLLVADDSVNVVEGEWHGSRTVVVEFDSMDTARAWYDSSEYQEALKIRQAASTCHAVFVQGYVPRGLLA